MSTLPVRLLLPLLLCFVLAGCSRQAMLQYLIEPAPEKPVEKIHLAASEQSAVSPAELLPEPVETEQCIAQELDALKKTGSWTEEQVPAAEQSVPIQQYDFPILVNKQVKMYLDLFQNRQKRYFKRWLARSSKYREIIHHELEQAGLPKDLLYLAMIESGFNQRARSRAKATGMWQFMKGTGRDYNLRVDRYVDERRDVLKSTRAAVSYLADLHARFGDWHLAVAAYNGGPGTISNGLRKYKVSSFWELAEKRYLRLETKRYVPKLIAAIIISKNPEKYGFENVPYEAPLEFDTIEVGPGFSLDALALISDSNKREIRLLNQELKTGKTPMNRRKYIAKIPKDSQALASANLSRLHSIVKTGYKTHITSSNETLTSICRKYRINKTTLLKVNNLRSAKLQKGQRLRIPYSTVDYRLLPDDGKAMAQYRDSLILHTIKPGETISKIARQYSVPQNMIASWNGLSSIHNIRAGQQLALYILKENRQSGGSAPQTEHQTENSNIIVFSGKNKKAPSMEKEQSSGQRWYHVKAGDTLWNISRRFNTSPSKIRRWNNLKSNLIHPGIKLMLKDA